MFNPTQRLCIRQRDQVGFDKESWRGRRDPSKGNEGLVVCVVWSSLGADIRIYFASTDGFGSEAASGLFLIQGCCESVKLNGQLGNREG